MHTIILDRPSMLISWAEQQLGVRFFEDARAIGWGNDTAIRAVAIYERWSGNDCCVHLVSDGQPGWLARPFLAAGFHYPFVTAGLRRITGLVPANNDRAIRLNQHFGYREEGCLRHGVSDGVDLIIMGMLREECRFIPRKFRNG
ncbi:GNAT family N-acetyltransferase [Sphingobium cupriresistens]|uniref:GNAT family N-acetyltransferase n=1 Tax=Sphingobium cupriresistens TaxID=1132417 RepID=UPI003BAE0080